MVVAPGGLSLRDADVWWGLPTRFLAGGRQLGNREERLALPSDRDAGTAGKVKVIGNLPTGLPFVVQTVANDFWHPSLVPVPVDLETFGIPHIQIICSDEIEGGTLGICTNPLDDNSVKSGLWMGREDLRAGDFEGVTSVGCSHDDSPRIWVLEGSIPSVIILYHSYSDFARLAGMRLVVVRASTVHDHENGDSESVANDECK
jgi:hypothetical protein